jgi:asparagine synthase (glutamine-hydrolysing)
VLHHASKHLEKVRTFSIGFDLDGVEESEVKKYNADSRLAERTAEHYGTEHSTFALKNVDVARELEHIYQTIDEPVSTSTSVSQYFLNRWVREAGVVVAFGGDGGDELFGGYTRHRAMMAAYYFQMLPTILQNAMGHMHPRGKKLQTPFFTPLHLELMATDDVAIRSALMEDLETMKTTEEFFKGKYVDIPKGMHPLEVYMRVDRHTWLADHSLTRSDRTSMIHGIEFRVPLLDLEVVEYADGVASYRKSDPFVGKKIIRKEYRNHLPEHLYKEPKRGWLSPGAKWLRDPLIGPVVRAILSPEYYNGTRGLFDWEGIGKTLDGHTSRGQYALHPLWGILILQIWARKHNIRW